VFESLVNILERTRTLRKLSQARSAGAAARGDADPTMCGSFRLLFDETSELEDERARREAAAAAETLRRGTRSTYVNYAGL
jgi:hypothetical protein